MPINPRPIRKNDDEDWASVSLSPDSGADGRDVRDIRDAPKVLAGDDDWTTVDLYAADKAPAEKKGTIGAFARTFARVPENLAAKTIMAIQGQAGASVADKGVADRFVNWVDERNRRLSEEYTEAGDFIPGVITRRDVAELGPNLAFSGVSMGGTIAGGLAAAPVPVPGARIAGGLTGGMAAAYRMDTYQVMNDWLKQVNQESIGKGLGPISIEEEKKFKKDMSALATEHGAWEAGPEGFANILQLALLTAKNVPGARWLPEKLTGKVAKGALRFTGVLGAEQITETVTQMGQQRAESEAGLTGEAPREWTSGADMLKSAKEVMPQVLLMAGFMSAGGAAYRKVTKPESAARDELLEDYEKDATAKEILISKEEERRVRAEALGAEEAAAVFEEEVIEREPAIPGERPIRPKEEAIEDDKERERRLAREEREREELGRPIPEPVTGREEVEAGRVLEEAVDETRKVNEQAQEAAASPLNDTPAPTESQLESGNYKKGHIKVQGLDIAVENPDGSQRTGTDQDGETWSVTMAGHYGYFKRSEGKDGEQIDVFVNADTRYETDKAYIVDQVDPKTGKFDEHKVMMGYPSIEEAEKGYLANYEKDWKGLGNITEVSVEELKEFTEKRQTSPYAEMAKKVAPEIVEKESIKFVGTRETAKGEFPIFEDKTGFQVDYKPAEHEISNIAEYEAIRPRLAIPPKPTPPEAVEKGIEAKPIPEVAPKPPAKPIPSKIRTLRGAIKELGGIDFLYYTGELKDLEPSVKKAISKKGAVGIDQAVNQLIADGWLDRDTTVASFLEDLRTKSEALLRRDRIAREITEKKPYELSAEEKRLKAELEREVEAPPEGDYVTINAEDLPKGKELTLIEGKTARGWDVYEVTAKDPFEITLMDGKEITLSPLDKVQVLKTEIEVVPKVEKIEAPPEKVPTKPEPGKAWIKGKQRPIMAARLVTKGKNKGKYEITLTRGRDAEGNIIPGVKRVVEKKAIITMPKEIKPYEKPTKKEIEVKEAVPTAEGGVAYTTEKIETEFPQVISDRAGSYKSGVRTIVAPQDAAAFAHLNLSKYPQEHLASVILDKDRKIISVHRYSIGAPGQAPFSPSLIAGHALNTPDAANLIIVHNHPSGDPLLSPADVRVFDGLKNTLKGTRVSANDIIAVGENKYSSYSEDWQTGFAIPDVKAKYEIPMVERVFKQRGKNLYKVSDEDSAAKFGKDHLPEGGLILLNTRNDAVGVLPMDDYSRFRDGMSEVILKQVDATNAVNIIAYNPDIEIPALAKTNLAKFAKATDLNLFDIIDSKGSWQAKGIMPVPEDEKFFAAKVVKPQDTITRQDLQSIFGKMKNIRTGVNPAGNFYFKVEGRPAVEILEVNHVDGFIQTKKGDEKERIPVGSYLKNTIELKTTGVGPTADIATAFHEYMHFLERNGFITTNDIKALDSAIGKAEVTEEDRATYVGDRLAAWQAEKNSRIKRILKKISDFANAIYEFFTRTRTARGVLREIETGKIIDMPIIEPALQAIARKVIGVPISAEEIKAFQVKPIKGPTFAETREPVTEEDWIANRKVKKDIKLTLLTNVKRVASEIAEGVDKYLGVISTRLGNVSPKLKNKLRQLDLDIGLNHAKDVKQVEPLLRKARKMALNDIIDWDYARKNSVVEKIDELVVKYGMQKEYAAYRDTLDKVREEGLDVGLEIGEIPEYAPRILKDQKGFLKAINKPEYRPLYTDRLKKRAADLDMTVEAMPLDMKADIISDIILGGWSGLGGVPATRQRVLKKIPAGLNKFYADSDAALMQHLYSMRKAIEARRFFGKIPKKVAEMRKRLYNAQTLIRTLNSNLAGKLSKGQQKELARLEKSIKSGKLDEKQLAKARRTVKALKSIATDTMPDEQIATIKKNRSRYIGLEREYTAYIATYGAQRDYTQNIGAYIIELIDKGEIDAQHEGIVNDILNARFHEKGTRGIIQAYKNMSYIDTMGSPISALTQIGDFAWPAYLYGVPATMKHAYRAAMKKSKITKEDIGVERVAQEFADSGTLGNAVSKVFKWVGLEKIDAIGKETLLNAALEDYQKQAKKNPAKLKKEIRVIFEAETDSVIEDLVNNEISDNVKLLVYHKLLDFQPVALSEVPQKYLSAGNGRIFYMLKTFTIKQFDIFRRISYNKIVKGDKAEKIEGLKNLVKMSMFFVLANAGADELKDWVLGRKTDFDDRVADNMLRLFGISKFVTWKARTEGVGSALFRQILPPFKFIDSAGKDIITFGDEKGLEVIGSIPVAGKLAYWHMGRGLSKREDLWNRRLRKRKARLNKTKDRLDVAKNKMEFRRKHHVELLELKRINKLQGRLNKKRKRINGLKSLAETVERKKQIQRLEIARTDMIKNFLGK